MGREEEFNNKKKIGVDLEKEEKDELQKIANRDYNGKLSPLCRKIIKDHIKAHADGNTQYMLDDFSKNQELIAIPALMSNREKLSKYVNEEYDKTELQKVEEQCQFLLGTIRSKLLQQACGDPEKFRIDNNRKDRFRAQNDIRFKDPKTMSETEKSIYENIKSKYSDKEWKDLMKRGKPEIEEIKQTS